MTIAETTTNFEMRYREALHMWLRWNAASQRLTERMFQERSNPENIQRLLDEVEQMRLDAVAASEQLLDG